MTILDERSIDGRSARRERNRREIVDALLELIRNEAVDASAAEVATKAGLSERSVFRYFDDVNDLYSEVCAVQFSLVQPRAVIDGFAQGTVDDKVKKFVDQRIGLHHAIGRVGVAARAHAHRNPVIAKQLIDARALLRRQITEHFATELATLDETHRLAAIASIDLCTTYEAIEMLFTEHRMTDSAVRDALKIVVKRALQ